MGHSVSSNKKVEKLPLDYVEISIPEQKQFDGLQFPFVLAPNKKMKTIDCVIDFVKSDKNMKFILKTLVNHGAILFRGFPIITPADFNQFVLAFKWDNFVGLEGLAVRRKITGVVFNTPDQPMNQLHHEMAHYPKQPSHLFYFCCNPATSGGEIPLCLSGVAYDKIQAELPEFVDKLKTKGVKYMHSLQNSAGRSWQSFFSTNDRHEAEKKSKPFFDQIMWGPDDGSVQLITDTLPAIKFESRTQKFTWYNNILPIYYALNGVRHASESAVVFGDNTNLNPIVIQRCKDIIDDNKVEFKWQKGDILLIDNSLVLHARNSFTPPRSLLVAQFDAYKSCSEYDA